jgi:hypothetical protein
LREESLGEEICQLMLRRNRKEFHKASKELLSNKMTINFEMLRSFMKNGVSSNMNRTTIVTIKDRRFVASELQIPEQIEQPLKLTCSSSKSPILRFRRRTRHGELLLRAPRDQ